MSWFTLKVQPAHEGRIRLELLERFKSAGIPVRIAFPTVWTGLVRGAQSTVGGLWTRRHKKIRPGYLFLRIDASPEFPPAALDVLDATRGVGAINCRDGRPVPVGDELDRLLETGSFYHWCVETVEGIVL